MSYFARLAMMLTIFEMVYLNLEVFARFFAIMAENKRLNDLLQKSINETPSYNRVNIIEPHITLDTFSKPWFPNLIILTSVGGGQFEGASLIPALYANTKRKENFNKVIFMSILCIFVYLLISSPVAILTFGMQIQEIVFMNLSQNQI